LYDQHTAFQLLNALIRKDICLKLPTLWHRHHREEAFQCEFRHGGLDDRTESHLTNPESNSSKFLGMLSKLGLKFGGNFVGADSLRPEKSNHNSLITLHPKRTLTGFSRLEWKNHVLESDTLKSNLSYQALRRLNIIEI
jgi:hypothetical protein